MISPAVKLKAQKWINGDLSPGLLLVIQKQFVINVAIFIRMCPGISNLKHDLILYKFHFFLISRQPFKAFGFN